MSEEIDGNDTDISCPTWWMGFISGMTTYELPKRGPIPSWTRVPPNPKERTNVTRDDRKCDPTDG